MRERIVYRHPKGRFEVVERSGTDIFGNPYRIREARLTPEKDERGRLTNADKLAVASQPSPEAETMEEPTEPIRRLKLSTKEQQRICTMWRQGFSIVQIARDCGRAESTINNVLLKKGLREPQEQNRWTDQEKKDAAALWRKGWSQKRIAEELGRSRASVAWQLRRMAKQTG